MVVIYAGNAKHNWNDHSVRWSAQLNVKRADGERFQGQPDYHWLPQRMKSICRRPFFTEHHHWRSCRWYSKCRQSIRNWTEDHEEDGGPTCYWIFLQNIRTSNQSWNKTHSKSGFDLDDIDVDPQLMFQRLIAAANGLVENATDAFKHELSSFPSSLFDNNGLPRGSCKSPLADAIWSLATCEADNTPDESEQHVIDGGSLLQRIPWRSESTFKDICHLSYQCQVYWNYIDGKTCIHIT